MTNVNMIEDKRITPPPRHRDPGFIPLCDEGECMRALCVEAWCVDICMSRFFFLCRRTCLCFGGRNKDSIWSEPLIVPVWNTLSFWTPLLEAATEVEWHRAGSSEGFHLQWPLIQGGPPASTSSWHHSLPYSSVAALPPSGEDTLSAFLASPPQLSNSIQCNYMRNKENGEPGRLCW